MKTQAWDAARKEEVYNKIDCGEYGTKETTEPNCRKILNNASGNLVGYICIKCGRVFSDCSGGYRYQHIRNCTGSETNRFLLKKRYKFKPKMGKPIPIPPTRLTNAIPTQQVQALYPQACLNTSNLNNSSFMSLNTSNDVSTSSNGFHLNDVSLSKHYNGNMSGSSSEMDVTSWLSQIPTPAAKEKFVVELSKLLLDHLPLEAAAQIISPLSHVLNPKQHQVNGIKPSTRAAPAETQIPVYVVNETSSYGTPVASLHASNSPTPVRQIKSELSENGHMTDLDMAIHRMTNR